VKSGQAALNADQTGRSGTLTDVLDGADVYIGVSGGTVPEEDIARMAGESIIFALANPMPEVHPDVAHRYARIVATGRSDFPNQINNVLAFPGIFRGALDVHASAITEGMKIAAATALAGLVGDDLAEDLIVPSPFDPRVGPAVSAAVAGAARQDGVARA
jgi:malate dehydrogenase (oxaloacetate-decarboxylating)